MDKEQVENRIITAFTQMTIVLDLPSDVFARLPLIQPSFLQSHGAVLLI